MNAVQKCTFDKRGWNAFKKMTVFQHEWYGMLCVADKNHRSRSFMSSFSSVKRFVGQIILHGINKHRIRCSAFLLFKLIPSHNIPISHQTKNFLISTHLYKKTSTGNITTRNENPIGREFLKHM